MNTNENTIWTVIMKRADKADMIRTDDSSRAARRRMYALCDLHAIDIDDDALIQIDADARTITIDASEYYSK